jgi:hypothetical protein
MLAVSAARVRLLLSARNSSDIAVAAAREPFAARLHYMRCLKRALARLLYPLIPQTMTNIANAHTAA